MCFVWIWEQTAIISLYSINWLVFVTETECVYCAVLTGSLDIILRSAHKVYLCVLCGSENKQRLFPYTALTDCYFITETECVYYAVGTGSLCIILRSAHTLYLCVLCGSENKQRLFPYTTFTDRFLQPKRRVFTARYGLDLYTTLIVSSLKCWHTVLKFCTQSAVRSWQHDESLSKHLTLASVCLSIVLKYLKSRLLVRNSCESAR